MAANEEIVYEDGNPPNGSGDGMGDEEAPPADKLQHKRLASTPFSGDKDEGNLPVYISWNDLKFEVPERDKKLKKENPTKHILKGLSGSAHPGELLAVIGPSGSGKSSFLNCLGGRNVEGVSGEVLFNGVPRPASVARFTGYVIQDDLYFESLTVIETLTFAADLKLPMSFSKAEKRRRIEEIMDRLDLNKCAKTKVGTIGDGISGGERRRLSIAIEIINEPSLLLLDEPTSGLDAASALLVGKILHDLAKEKGLTIIASIHQPRHSLAKLFDKLYFLADGREMYFGRSFPYALDFFTQVGYECPTYENPADFLLDLVNTRLESTKDDKDPSASSQPLVENKSEEADLNGKKETRMEIVAKIAEAYNGSQYKKDAQICEVPANLHGDIVFSRLEKSFYITPFYNQVKVVCHRSFIHKFREPIAMMTQATNSIIMPLLFGSIYWNMNTSVSASYDRINAISLVVLMNSFLAFDVLILFPSERSIFNREQASGMYRPSAFYIGRTMSEFPQHTLFSFIMATISYWMYGLQSNADKYWTWVAINILEVSAGAGLLYAFGAMSANLEQSNILATMFLLIFMLFDGNWLSLDQVPVFWSFVPHISFLGYAGQAAMANEYRGLEFDCTQKEIDNGNCIYESGGITGEQILKQRGLKNEDIPFALTMLVVLNIVYRFIAFLCVLFMYRPMSAKYIAKHFFN